MLWAAPALGELRDRDEESRDVLREVEAMLKDSSAETAQKLKSNPLQGVFTYIDIAFATQGGAVDLEQTKQMARDGKLRVEKNGHKFCINERGAEVLFKSADMNSDGKVDGTPCPPARPLAPLRPCCPGCPPTEAAGLSLS